MRSLARRLSRIRPRTTTTATLSQTLYLLHNSRLSLFSTSTTSTTTSPTPTTFSLSDTFVDSFKNTPTNFGYNGLGEVVYQRTYSRPLQNGTPEQWFQTVARVVNGTYGMQKRWALEKKVVRWDEKKAQKSAKKMYKLMFDMKFLPPGRGLWAMGTAITEERHLYAALNNCAFVSTGGSDVKINPSGPFLFLMDASMLGVGVGFDTLAAGQVQVLGPSNISSTTTLSSTSFVVPDSREGWVESLRILLDSYFHSKELPIFDYSDIRPAGSPIKGFGGVSAGSDVLVQLHDDVKSVLDRLVGHSLTITSVVDIMNLIGRCVVSGNVRRTAEIAFGDPLSEEYIDLKNYEKNPERAGYGWTSNNSVFAELGMNYEPACERIRANGEPGFAWLDNMRSYGRMNGVSYFFNSSFSIGSGPTFIPNSLIQTQLT